MGNERERSFGLAGGWTRWPWLFGGLQFCIAVNTAAMSADNGGWARTAGFAFAPLGMLFAAYIVLYTPRAVTLDDAGVRLKAPARTIAIPWDELDTVAERGSGLGRPLVWRRRHGRPVHTSTTWEHQDEMLAAIDERLAPAADGVPDRT